MSIDTKRKPILFSACGLIKKYPVCLLANVLIQLLLRVPLYYTLYAAFDKIVHRSGETTGILLLFQLAAALFVFVVLPARFAYGELLRAMYMSDERITVKTSVCMYRRRYTKCLCASVRRVLAGMSSVIFLVLSGAVILYLRYVIVEVNYKDAKPLITGPAKWLLGPEANAAMLYKNGILFYIVLVLGAAFLAFVFWQAYHGVEYRVPMGRMRAMKRPKHFAVALANFILTGISLLPMAFFALDHCLSFFPATEDLSERVKQVFSLLEHPVTEGLLWQVAACFVLFYLPVRLLRRACAAVYICREEEKYDAA